MDFDVLLQLNKTPCKKQACTTTAAQNAPNPGNHFPFVFFLYNLIPSINRSGLYFQCNKRCIVKGRWRQETLITSSAFPKGLVPSSSCNANPPGESPAWRGGLEGRGGRRWEDLALQREISSMSCWQPSSKPLCLPAAARGAGRSLHPECWYPGKNVAVNIIFLCCLIFSLSIICTSLSASDSNPLNKAQPGYFLFFGL